MLFIICWRQNYIQFGALLFKWYYKYDPDLKCNDESENNGDIVLQIEYENNVNSIENIHKLLYKLSLRLKNVDTNNQWE